MKNLSRLTALLLALVMLLSITASATEISNYTKADYDADVVAAQSQTDSEAVITTGGEVIDRQEESPSETPIYETVTERALSMHADGVGAEVPVELSMYGKVKLSVGESGGQWQVNVLDQWVAVSGETGSTFDVTFAKVQSLFQIGGAAKVRYLSADGTTVSNTAVIGLTYAISTLEEEEELPSVPYTAMRAATPAVAAEGDAEVTADATTPPFTTYIVQIDYMRNGSAVATSYTAQLSKGANYTATVKFPIVPGYVVNTSDILVGGEGKDAVTLTVGDSTLTYAVADLQGNVTITVNYVPTMVNYTVNHYQQNVGDDKYQLVATETDHQALTESIVPAFEDTSDAKLVKNYDGFYALWYEPEAVAADGSTVINIYYDRNYYLMLFNLDGGYGVEPIYARFGADVSVPNPTRMGYVFNGWSPAVPSTVPVNGGTYTAQWTAQDTTYTVVYWQENANDSDYSYYEHATVGALSGTEVSGSGDKTYEGFHFDHADTDIPVKGDGSSIVNVYYKRNTYTLTFAYDGGELICNTHVHSTDCYEIVCGKTEHKHTYESSFKKGSFRKTTYYIGGCYPPGDADAKSGGATKGNEICGMEEHEHTTGDYWTESCYGSTVVCGQTGVNNHTHSVANGCYGVKFGGIKYGQATDTYWAKVASLNKKWTVSYGSSTFYTNAPAMPNSNLIIYGTSTSGSSTIHYYEKVNGQETTNKVREDYVVNDDGWSFTEEDYIVIPGFTYSSSRKNYSGTQYYIYYTRNSYTLTFKNGNKTTDGGTHLYEADISSTYFKPNYTGDDADAYEFGGWYTTEACIEGTQFVFEDAKMPYNNLILYAKWVPVTHTVSFYLDREAMEAGNKLSTHSDIKVTHGKTVTEEIDDPSNGGYTFVAWFYLDNGVEKAFDFNNMPVNRDLKVYAKWSAKDPVEYTIKYVIRGTDTEIAERTTGKALPLTNKYFEAKVGDELDVNYRTGYFPVLPSHSVRIDIDPSKNVYEFEYVQADKVPYTVRYLIDNGDGTYTEAYPGKEVVDNTKSVVTEPYKPLSGYMPDAAEKRLILSVDENGNPNTAANVITFIYTKNEAHAYYTLSHYYENLDGTYTLIEKVSAVGDIGTTYSHNPHTDLTGYEYVESKTELVVGETTTFGTSAELTGEGLEIKHYYDRTLHPYTVQYLEEGTNKVLHEEKTVPNNMYGATVQENAETINGYTPTLVTQSLTIGSGTNEIIFYYTEKDATINYVVVGPEGCGTVTPASETIKMVTGVAQGSTAAASSNTYKFVGWYTDAACTQQISTDAAYVPGRTEVDGVVTNGIWPATTTYYAKFEYNVTDLKIVKTGAQVNLDPNACFIFTVTGEGINDSLQVVIKENGSATIEGLTVGETYTVTEAGDWSWRYTATCDHTYGKITLVPEKENNVITFSNTRTNDKWIDSDCYAENNFGEASN